MKLVGAKFKINGKDAGDVRLSDSGSVVIQVTDPAIQMELKQNGVLGPGKKRLTTSDGLDFIKGVIRQYSGSYVQAVGILE